MDIRYLSKTEQELTGADVAVRIKAADVVALGAAADNASTPLNILPGGDNTLPAKTLVKLIAMRLDTPFDFSDTGITSLQLKVGDGGDDDRFLAATEVAVDGTEILASAGTGTEYAYAAADTVDAIFTAANGGSPLLSECTAGDITLFFRQLDLTRLPNA